MSNDLHNPDFFSNDGKPPSKEDMYRYLDQEMTPAEQHAMEADLLDDEFLSEAMEGLAEVKDREKVAALLGGAEAEFLKKLETKEEEEKIIKLPPMGWLVAAAVAMVLVVFSFIYFEQLDPNSGKDTQMASGETVEKSDPAEKPNNNITLGDDEWTDDKNADPSREQPEPQPIPLEEKLVENQPPAPAIMDAFDLEDAEVEEEEVMAEEILEFDFVETEDDMDFDMSPAMESSNMEPQLEKSISPAILQNRTIEETSGGSADIRAGQRGVANYDDYVDGHRKFSKEGSSKIKSKPEKKKNKNRELDANNSAPRVDEAISEPLSGSAEDFDSIQLTAPYRVGNSSNTSYELNEVATSGSSNRVELTMKDNTTIITPSRDQQGFTRYASHDFKGAAKSYEKAIAENPNNYQARYYLGLSYIELGKESKAIAQFDYILQNEPNPYFEDAEWYRAETLIKANQKDLAKKSLESIRSRNGKYRSKAEESLKAF